MTDLLPRLAIFLCVVLALWFAERQLAWHRVPAMRAPVRVANVILGAVGVVAIAVIARYRNELIAAFEAGIQALRMARGG